MELKEYVEDVLMVLKKNDELERLVSNLADDSALATAKNTILDIEKRVVKDRIIELTEQYLGKANITEEKGKEKKKRFSFVRTIDAPIDIPTTTPKPTKAQLREEKKREKEMKREEAKEKAQVRKKQQLEAELAALTGK